MTSKKLLWKILFFTAFFSIVPLIIISAYIYSSIKDSYINNYINVLVSDTRLIKEKIEFAPMDVDYISISREYDEKLGARVTIIDTLGKVLADSRHEPLEMENHSNRPEVIDAMKGKTSSWHRFSFTLTDDMLYAAMPVYNKSGSLFLIVRTAINTIEVEKKLNDIRNKIIISVFIISIILLVSAYLIFNRTLKPLFEMRDGAERFSRGLFAQKIYPPRDETLRNISDSLNSMASQIDEKLGIIEEQGNIQQAVLRSMKEGIIAVDDNERILLLNQTANDILGIGTESVIGKTLQEIVRISEIQKFFMRVAAEVNPQETEIIIDSETERSLQLSGTQLYDIDNKVIGTLVVLNDITNLKYLDAVKKDLVANVSHELKTPVTTIKGFIETLRDGAINDRKNAERFLDIVLKHIERLNLLIDDLLTLAKLEQRKDDEVVELEYQLIKPILESVAEDFEIKADHKKIIIKINCDKGLSSKVNRHLLEQAIGNLIDNAIKYSDKKTAIVVGSYKTENELNIYVSDEGYGIAEENLPRLFERFYRIDKARGREEGGTGLGLAIVKHIMNAMNGKVEVESMIGKGSKFNIRLPLK
ncbi:MAG TPA: ATP-binding protein [Ignavibacteria bacterium]|nr:ATP-binding protein [Ignavibacteria bacterium]